MNIQNSINEIDEITGIFKSVFGKLVSAQLNWKPDPDTWSIGQNIDHLIVINKTYFPVFDSLNEGTFKIPFLGKFDLVTDLLGNFILKSVLPETQKRIKTFPIWQPSQSSISLDIFQKFEDNQEKLKKYIINSEDFIAKKSVISSPANKNIVYKLDKAFDIIICHEKRHFKQAKEILDMQRL